MKTKNILHILFIAFIVRFFLLIINTYWFVLPHGDGDAITFEHSAYLISLSDYDIDIKMYLSAGAKLYSLLLSFIYLLLGHYPFILGLTNVLLGTYVVYLAHKASLLLWNKYDVAKKAAWITALFPLLMLESALVLREMPMITLMLLGIIALIKYWKYRHSLQIIKFIFFTFLAALLHSGMLFILIGFLFFVNFSGQKGNYITKIFAVLLVISTLVLMNQTGIGTNKIGGGFENSIELLQQREQYETKGGSKYPDWMRLAGNKTDIIKIPIRYIAFLFSPLIPWLVRSLWHTLGLIDALAYFIMFFIIIKNREIFRYNSTAKAIFIITIVTALVFSLGVSNVGTATRHRAKFAPLLIILASGMNKQQLLKYKQQYLEFVKQFKKNNHNYN